MSLGTVRIAMLWGVLLAVSYSLVCVAQAEERQEFPELLSVLKKGGHIIYLRHAATERSQIDKNREDLSQWQQQRNLSELGREQARVIGRVIRTLVIPISEVISSPYCRCKETAHWAFGQHTTSQDLAFSIAMPKAEAERLGAFLQRLLGKKPAGSGNRVVIAHTANLKQAAKLWPKPEGVAMIFRPLPDGAFKFVGRIAPDEWVTMAEASGVEIKVPQQTNYPDLRPVWCDGGMNLDAKH